MPTTTETRTRWASPRALEAELARRSCLLASGLLLLGLSTLCGATAAFADVFLVNSTGDRPDADPGDGTCSTGFTLILGSGRTVDECTLRAAMHESNALAGADEIHFSSLLPTVGGVVEVRPQTPLPGISDPVTIDGTTAAGYDAGDPWASPKINLLGHDVPPGTAGLSVWTGGDGSVIRAIAIDSFPGDGIVVSPLPVHVFPPYPAPDHVVIEGCHLGVWRGVFYRGNDGFGIQVAGASYTRVGLDCSMLGCHGRGNLIASNGSSGIRVAGAGTAVRGNRIGTDRFGMTTFVPLGGSTPNGGYGIEIALAGGRSTIGSPHASGGNLVSGNTLGGILVEGNQTSIVGNRIGTNRHGTSALPNEGSGIHVTGQGNWIGPASTSGDGLESGNLISGNEVFGIYSAAPNEIRFNTIGLDRDRSAPLANSFVGIRLAGSDSLVEGNVVAGNALDGIQVLGTDHRIVANYVGTTEDGAALPNGDGNDTGISIWGDSNQIGDVGFGNTIGFQHLGVWADGDDNRIQGNFVGTDASARDLGNVYGIRSTGFQNRVGGLDGLENGLANTVGFNSAAGIDLWGGGASQVQGNYVGTNAGADPLPNDLRGILVDSTASTIGASLGMGPQATQRRANVVAHSGLHGISVASDVSESTIRGNILYANAGLPAIDLSADGATPNDFGDIDTGANNLQNHPEFVPEQTRWNPTTEELEVRYRIVSNEGDAAYPLTVDFYLVNSADGEADEYIGSDTYPAASATLYRAVSIDLIEGATHDGLLFATATDANGNTSELSVQSIPVPEPDSAGALCAGALLLVLQRRWSRGARPR